MYSIKCTMSALYFNFIFLSLLYIIYCQEKSNCNTKETCSDCIQALGCIWCSKPYNSASNNSLVINCENENYEDIQNWCPEDKLYAPTKQFVTVKNETLKSQTDGNAVQIYPQRIKLTLRKGEEFVLPFQYRQAEDYPVDLYYIMDLSASMEDHRDKLAKLGGTLAKAMRSLTSNFKLGFGSFVDKTDMPFVSTVPEKLNRPCTLVKENGARVICVPPYSFKNHMSLTDNATAFSNEVNRARVSGNLDFPEGGLDAVMQAMVCKEEIGWREKARHLIVFSTDADFHIAGDGKLAGVVEPNDAQCHMLDDQYTHGLVYDYPSVSQVNYVAKQNNINLIFAIAKGKDNNDRIVKIYEKLQQRIENSAVGGLDKDSANVVRLVIDNYNKIVDTVVITDNSGNDVEIKYSSNCPKPKENGCTNIHVGETINFTASIRPLVCQQPGSGPQIIKIKPEGIDESLEIELDVTCECPCEQPGHPEFSQTSRDCTNQGDLKCGVCSCFPGRFGRNCECDSSTSTTDDVRACKRSENDTEICSGLGSCKCGKCECSKRPSSSSQVIYGKYCECDNFSCKRNNGHICSGRGMCDCGECICQPGWVGDACECLGTNATCIWPTNGEVCSGKGDCICGECQCHIVNGYRHSGKYCEECPSCPAQRCEELRHCVECQAYKTGLYNQDQCSLNCTTFTTEVIEKIDEENVEENIKICRSPDNSGCTIIFQYSYDDNNELIVKAQETKICSGGDNILAIVLGVIGSIVLAGIILLIIWKVCTNMHDRREYAKFENERANAKWQAGDNPLYRKATSEFKNPLYKQ